MWDTDVQVAGIANRMTKPGTTWELVTADDALGQQLEADTRTLVEARGGRLIGSVRHLFPATHPSSAIVAAQGSGADIVALANAGGDTITGVKTARDFGLIGGRQQRLAFFLTVMDVRSLGLATAQGTTLTEGFHWDLDAGTRAFSERFRAQNGTVPSAIHAGLDSAVRHHLKAVAVAGSDEAATTIATLRRLPIVDDVVRNARLREDGRMVHDFSVFEVKTPAESRGEWHYYRLVATIPGDEAFRRLSQSTCPAIRQ